MTISDLKEISSVTFEDVLITCIPFNEYFVLKSSPIRSSGPVVLYNVVEKTSTVLGTQMITPIILDKNHVVAYDASTKNFVILFILKTATFSEILDEIKIRFSTQPKQSVKRSASPTREIPAAAQGVGAEKREAKQPRLEKPNG